MNTEILENIRALKRQILPNDRLILFGSQARGDARPDSDWDLLVLLDKEGEIEFEDNKKYAFPFDEIGWDYGAEINTLLYSTKEWNIRHFTPFYKNVTQDGIEIK
jgi:predicted nucleotidyltransferase